MVCTTMLPTECPPPYTGADLKAHKSLDADHFFVAGGVAEPRCYAHSRGMYLIMAKNEVLIREIQLRREGMSVLCSAEQYFLRLLQSFLGEGCFGRVAQCLRLPTKETVAVKILKAQSKSALEAEKELAMLEVVSSLDPDAHHIVRFHEGFFYRGLTCLVFEQLHMSLLDYMRQTHFRPLSLNEIRPITVQLATAFTALKSIGLIHTDLKPDNIMLVDQVSQPFRVKLIDFGLAVSSSEVQRGSILQPLGYRAPEVVLGLPISEAIDMWSLGCVMAAMFLGRHLYPSRKEFDMMRAIVATQGMPADHLLDAGLRTRCLFTRDSNHQTWRLKLPWEYFRDTGKSPRCPSRFSLGSLDVLLECRPEGADEHEEEDI